MRGLVQASSLPKVCAQLGITKVSLGSFSETQHLVDPSLLEALFASLAGELPDLKELPPSLHGQHWMARDSSLFPALPRIAWALYGGGREGCTGELLHLATNLPPAELRAGDAALLYKNRWQVEYFFRWVKCLLGCGHWLVESPRGVTHQLYLALIGALLLQLDLGRRPGKRVRELYQWHQTGLLDDAELAQALAAQLAREEQARAKKTKATTQ